MDKKVIILSFSPRNNGNCSNIADFIVQYYGKVNTTRFDITAENISPCYNCNYECLRSQSLCPRITDYQMQVMDASVNGSVIYFIVPNFCGQPNANYYAFNERSVGYFNLNQQLLEKYLSVRKRFIIVSNTENETFVNAMQQQTNETPEILYLKTRNYGKQSISGDLLESEAALHDLQAYLSTYKAL